MFKRINRAILELYCSDGRQGAKMAPAALESLSGLLDTLVRYGEKQASRQDVAAAAARFAGQTGSAAFSCELETDVHLFEKKQLDDTGRTAPAASFWDTVKSRANVNHMIYALKVAFICAGGMLATELLHLPKAYLFPLSVVVVTQPYAKLTRKAAVSRILNTVYMVIIYLLAFSFTDIIWLNILILVVTIVVGDIFLKFNFNVVISGIVAVAMGSMASSSGGMTGAQYAFIRLAYVCAACILIVLIDALFFPRHINESVSRLLRKSVLCNRTILACLTQPDTTPEALLRALREKRDLNRQLKFNQQYVHSETLSRYLLSDQEWTERVYFLYDGLSEGSLTMEQVCRSCHMLRGQTGKLPDRVQTEQDRIQLAVTLNLYELLKGMQESERIAEEQPQPAGKV